MINQDRMISAIYPSILNQFTLNFAKAIFYSKPNSPDNFVKLYSVFQKLDHLTCGKFKLRHPSITISIITIKPILELYYMANGLALY